MLGGNRERTGFYPGGKVSPPFVIKWEYDISADGSLYNSPIIVGGILYHGTATGASGGIIRALDSHTGGLYWSVLVGSVNGMLLSAYDNGFLYFGVGFAENPSMARKMRVSDQATIWTFNANWGTTVLPVGSLIYVLDQFGYGFAPTTTLYCVDRDTGVKNWELGITPPMGQAYFNATSWHNGVAFVGGLPMYALRDNPLFPDIKWTHPYSRALTTTGSILSVANGKVYLPFQSGTTSRLEAIDEETGALRWAYDISGGKSSHGCAVAGNRIFMPAFSGTLYAVDDLGNSGLLAWQKYISCKNGGTWSPIVVNGYVYMQHGYLSAWPGISALDANTGTIEWTQTMTAYEGGLAFSDGLLYVSNGFRILCIGKPISVHLATDRQSAFAGDVITYTIKLNSYGGPAASIILVATLPAEVVYQTASNSGAKIGPVVAWNNLNVKAADLQSVSFSVKVRDDLALGTYILRPTAFITYAGLSEYTDMESEEATTTVMIASVLPPGDLTAVDECGGIVTSWRASHSLGITGYRMSRSTTLGGTKAILATLDPSATIYLDGGLTAGTVYYYVVSAITGAVSSSFSNEMGTVHAGCGSVTHLVTPYQGPVRVYPNPFIPSTAVRGTLKFEGMPVGAKIRIYTPSGLKVWEGKVAGLNIVEWDGKTSSGKRVVPGTYLWVAEGHGRREKGTLIVQ